MKYQNFVGKIGFGTKGYSLLLNNKKINAVFITGVNADYSIIYNKIKKIFNRDIPWIKIKKRNNLNEVKKISNKLIKKKITLVIVSGGGSIIDFSKNIVHSVGLNSKKKIFFYIIPSKIGSGAEASISSVINLKNKKMIKVNENYLPNGIIYDLKFIQTLSKPELIAGSVDAITHCLESLSSVNKNDYLDFLSVNSINHFMKKMSIDQLLRNKITDEKIIKEFCILSFNGGTAQNNAGSGLCHALAHAAEKLTNLPHATCVSYFLLPVINYSLKVDKKYLSPLPKQFKNKMVKKIKFLKNKLNFKKISSILSNKNGFNSLMSNAMQDPCWKIYNKTVRVDILKNSIKNFKI